MMKRYRIIEQSQRNIDTDNWIVEVMWNSIPVFEKDINGSPVALKTETSQENRTWSDGELIFTVRSNTKQLNETLQRIVVNHLVLYYNMWELIPWITLFRMYNQITLKHFHDYLLFNDWSQLHLSLSWKILRLRMRFMKKMYPLLFTIPTRLIR